MTDSPDESTLPRSKRALSLGLISVSLLLNILALSLPFMQLRQGISKEPYSLLNSVVLLWEKGLFVLVVLVVGFSLLFPFAKLGVLLWVALSRNIGERQLKWLHVVEFLGKWSMLDAFLVSIILALASNQFFVDGTPLIGLSCFIVAILLSMVTGEMLSRSLRQPADEVDGPSEGQSGIWLALSGLALLGTLLIPFLSIEDWILKNREYSILTLGPVLFAEGAWMAAGLVICFLIIAPILSWTASFLGWRNGRKGIPYEKSRYWIQLAQRWNMLDVFGLSLVVFALESDQLMKTEIRWGALFLGGTLALQVAFNTLLRRALR